MCQRCDKEVIQMGVLESDLPNLPYKFANWFCMVPGCTHKAKVRDYGLAPYYYWPVIIRRKPDGWRGGWFRADHGYLCGAHWADLKREGRAWWRSHLISEKELLEKVQPIAKKAKGR